MLTTTQWAVLISKNLINKYECRILFLERRMYMQNIKLIIYIGNAILTNLYNLNISIENATIKLELFKNFRVAVALALAGSIPASRITFEI